MSSNSAIWGITGQVGAGKSTTGNLLEEFGAINLEVDAVGHVLLTSPDVRQALVDAFGGSILAGDGNVDRRLLGRVAFSSAATLAALNSILHPLICVEVRRKIADLVVTGTPLILVNAALLYQMHLDDICSRILYVRATEAQRLTRLLESRGWTEERAKARLNSQDQPPVQDARVIWVDNHGDILDLRRVLAALVDDWFPAWKGSKK